MSSVVEETVLCDESEIVCKAQLPHDKSLPIQGGSSDFDWFLGAAFSQTLLTRQKLCTGCVK